MKPPARMVIGNLVWSLDDGSVWAVLKVPARSYPYLDNRSKLAIHGRLRSALLALPDESMLLSVCRRVDPAELERRMRHEVQGHPAWEQEAAGVRAAMEADDALPMYDRLHYLAYRLPSTSAARGLTALLAAGAAGLNPRFGLPLPAVRKGVAAAYARMANEVAGLLRPLIGSTPATAGEIRWLYARAPLRGLVEPRFDATWEPADRRPVTDPEASVATTTLSHLFADACFSEGGQRAKAKHSTREPDVDPPRHRRYLRIDSDAGTTYQSFVALADLPRSWTFPGGLGEWLTMVDDFAFPVEWCCRITVVPNERAQVKARKQARELVAQVEQYESEPSGPPAVLAEAMGELEAQRVHLATHPADPELLVTTYFALADPSLPELEAQARAVAGLFGPNGYTAVRPTGDQGALFRAMLPGSASPAVARDYQQFLLPADFASAMPFATAAVGDEDGILIGYSQGAGSPAPVLAAFDRAPSRNRSGSWAAFGQLGSGKSYFTKRAMRAVLARGGRVVVTDKTRQGEYVRFSRVCPGTVQIVGLGTDVDSGSIPPMSRGGGKVAQDSRILGAGFVLDPMRMFGGDARVAHTTGFLALLAGTNPTDLAGVVLSEAVAAVAENPAAKLTDVVGYLEHEGAGDPEARVVGRKLRAAARSPLGRVVFGEGDVLDLTADLIVFHVPGLALPERAMLTNAHLAKSILPEQLFGWALLYLVSAVTRHATFADRSRFAAGIYDEARMLTASPFGRQLLMEVVRDGRKHNAAAWIISQHPDDLGDRADDEDRIADLLKYRLVFGCERGAAEAALRFMDMSVTPDNVELVTSLADGEFRDALFRDMAGRVGRVSMLLEGDEAIHAAADTNPAANGRAVVPA